MKNFVLYYFVAFLATLILGVSIALGNEYSPLWFLLALPACIMFIVAGKHLQTGISFKILTKVAIFLIISFFGLITLLLIGAKTIKDDSIAGTISIVSIFSTTLLTVILLLRVHFIGIVAEALNIDK